MCVPIGPDIFAWEPLIQRSELSGDVRSEWIRDLKKLLSRFIGSFGDLKSRNIFMSRLWKAKSPEIGMFNAVYKQE